MLDAVQNVWLCAAGTAALLTTVIHIFGGGPEVARPLLAARDIEDVPKYVSYYCWHLVTLTIGAMGVGLIWAAVDPTQTGLAWMWAVMATLFTLWSILLVIWKRQKPFHMPQWTLFGIVAGLAWVGLLG